MTDLLLVTWVSALIELAKIQWMLGRGKRWKPGTPLKLLFAGYNGGRNTGSDVRVEEMIKQVRHVLGPERCELAVMTHDPALTRGYFEGTRQVELPQIFPPFLYREVRKYDGAIACEASMFKSKFANALSTMMIGALGMASAENKISIGYGNEAGAMDPPIENLARRYCHSSLVLTRNAETQKILSELGIPTEVGTDTAWTFTPREPEYGRDVLRKAGWDGSAPVLVLCPINPFSWPVKASIAKFLARTFTGAYKESHYRTIYFHNSGRAATEAHKKYVGAFARAAEALRKRHNVFPILVAMERLDARACREISTMLGGAPVFTSDEYDMYQLVSILRCCSLMVASRYHAIVTSMPARVPAVGVTMDERIRNAMNELGRPELLFNVDDANLEEKLLPAMETLLRERESIRDAMARMVVRNLKVMARMGVYLEQNVHAIYPEFEIRTGVHSWEEYLPPLNTELRALVEKYDATGEAGEFVAALRAGAQEARA